MGTSTAPQSDTDSATATTRAVLITGAGGEMGHGLIEALAERRRRGGDAVVAVDLRELSGALRGHVQAAHALDVRDHASLEALAERYDFTAIFHLAAILSSGGERHPELAHEVNVDGTYNLLRLAAAQARRQGRAVRFLYPSTIAVYGLPDLSAKRAAGAVHEDEHCQPITIYGCSKLYGEHLGRYFSRHYRLLADEREAPLVDFRCIRFPGIIAAETEPSGGTSDYAPEMIHAAAQGRRARCFVRPDTRLPFTTMPEAVEAFLALAEAPAQRLSRCVYNIASFAPSAEEIAELVREHFPGSEIEFVVDQRRQAIVDSWPEAVDDGPARRDFGWTPRHDLRSAFESYLVPGVLARHGRARPR